MGGSEIISTIEIADNAGRTPIFEAVENGVSPDLARLLLQKQLKKRQSEGGFGAKVNVINYNGQTPLFSAVREGNMDLVKVLIDYCDATQVDLTGGEMVKDDAEDNDEFDSLEERNFMDAYKNSMTPLHIACILGYDEMAMFLIERG